jgi:hypothetical protein
MNYWISPSGHTWESEDIGRHYEMAVDIIIEKYPELLDAFAMSLGEKLYTGRDAVKDLEDRGYIRYMDWSDNPHWIIYNQKPTQRQQQKMFELTKFIYIEK